MRTKPSASLSLITRSIGIRSHNSVEPFDHDGFATAFSSVLCAGIILMQWLLRTEGSLETSSQDGIATGLSLKKARSNPADRFLPGLPGD